MSQVKSIHLVVSTINILTYRCVSPTVVVILLSMGLFVIHREILHKDLKSSRGGKQNKSINKCKAQVWGERERAVECEEIG